MNNYFLCFFKKLFFFIFLSVIFTIIVFYFINKSKREMISFKVDNDINYVFLGHSHIGSAYNDSIIKNSINLGEGGESYMYTYFKLQKLIKDNDENKITYFVEFTNNQIDTAMNRWIFFEPYISDKLPRYFFLMDNYSLRKIFFKKPLLFINASLLGVNLNLRHLKVSKDNLLPTLGAFASQDTSILKIKNKINNIQFNNNLVSNESIFYLKKIIALLKSTKSKFYLIRTPFKTTSSYYKNEAKYNEILKQLKIENYYIDLLNFKLKDSFYYDNEHLNKSGAYFYSKKFNDVLEKYGQTNSFKKEILKLVDDEN